MSIVYASKYDQKLDKCANSLSAGSRSLGLDEFQTLSKDKDYLQ